MASVGPRENKTGALEDSGRIDAIFLHTYQSRKMEQSVRHAIEGESTGLSKADKVVDILRTLKVTVNLDVVDPIAQRY